MNQIDQSQVYAFMQNQLGISLNKKKKKTGYQLNCLIIEKNMRYN